MQDVCDSRNRFMDEYATFSRSFSRIAADDLAARIDKGYARGRHWPEPLIQVKTNPLQNIE